MHQRASRRERSAYFALVGGSFAYPARVAVGLGRRSIRPSFSRTTLIRVLRDLQRDQVGLQALGQLLVPSPIAFDASKPAIVVRGLPNEGPVTVLRPNDAGRYRVFASRDWVEVPRAWRTTPADGHVVIALLREPHSDFRPLGYLLEQRASTAALVEAAELGTSDERESLVYILANRLDEGDAKAVVLAALVDPSSGVRSEGAQALLGDPHLLSSAALMSLAEAESSDDVRTTLSLVIAASGSVTLKRLEQLWRHWGWSNQQNAATERAASILRDRAADPLG